MTSNLVNESLISYLESAINHLKFFCDGLLSHNLEKTGPLKGFANFDFVFRLNCEKKKPRFAMVPCTTVLMSGVGCQKIRAFLRKRENAFVGCFSVRPCER